MPLSINNRLANVTLFALTLFYIMMLGGGTYEQINVASVITAAPPKSLAMLQGPYHFSPVKFWVIFRPITILLFILALGFHWRAGGLRKKILLFSFGIDILVTIATFAYFAPETGVIAGGPYSNTVDPLLVERAQLWKNLNLIRLGAFYGVAGMLLMAVNQNLSITKRNVEIK